MTTESGRAIEPGVVTKCDVAHTGSPQPVHIPGDNFSICRPDELLHRLVDPGMSRDRRPPVRTQPVDGDMSTGGSGPARAGRRWGRTGIVGYWRARLLMRAVSSV